MTHEHAIRLLLLGDNLLAEGLAQKLSVVPDLVVETDASALDETGVTQFTAVLLAGGGGETEQQLGHLLATCPALPVVHVDLERQPIHLCISWEIAGRESDLLGTLHRLAQVSPEAFSVPAWWGAAENVAHGPPAQPEAREGDTA